MSKISTPLLARSPSRTRNQPASVATRRILVVARWPLGGIRTHLAYNAPVLTEAGYRCTFVGPADPSLVTLQETVGHLPDAEFVGVPLSGKSCRLWPVVRSLLRSGDFNLIHSHGLTAGVHAVVGNFGFGVPHLATVHDPLRDEQFVGWKGWCKRWLMARLVARIDRLVCVTEDIRDNLAEYLPVLKKRPSSLVTIANGLLMDPYREMFGEASGELRRELGIGSETTLIGFLGRFMEQKGFLPLLEAIKLLLDQGAPRHFHLLAVGSADREREYRKAIARLGLVDWVTITPFVPDVREVLRQLDLLVIPSLWEASSLVGMEAMAAGVPVLGTDCIGLREVLRDTPSRMVKAGDVADLCKGLREALASPWLEEARMFAREAWDRFDNDPSARRLVKLYGELAA